MKGGRKKSDAAANDEQIQLALQNKTETGMGMRMGGEHQTLVTVPHSNSPNLDDGFYEIEAIRRKRMRKGQLQYLIKWRGWPETANTWEPLDNLQSVPEVIDAFEDCLRSGKQRRRKRKHVDHHTQPKKRHHRSATSYTLRRFPTPAADHHLQPEPEPLAVAGPLPPDLPANPQTVVFADELETNTDDSRAQPPNQNGFADASGQIILRSQENDYDPKLSELRATANNGVDADNLAPHVQLANASAGNGHPAGDLKVNSMDPPQSDRCRGAKRRKSGSVKRFKCPSEAVDTQKSFSVFGTGQAGMPRDVGNNSHGRNCNVGNIVKIIKPIGYSASLSGNTQDILVTFIAVRCDGAEVLVDNKYLKEHNPLLLINYYEQHLRVVTDALTLFDFHDFVVPELSHWCLCD
ncbi:chromo domain-containing protein LHP1 isoform X1 [Arachis hypogaea]|uniref:chromo domain-containing protein LHP1 isoform X1 n=1 Tax=Arachis hypogaea TaxID=3818 RepID=UPI003B21D315